MSDIAWRTGEWRRQQRGFTLLEVVVVLAIIGIVGLSVVPSLVQGPAADVSAPAAPLVTLLRTAQRAATDSGHTVLVALDPVSGRYEVRMAGRDSLLADGTVIFPDGSVMESDSIRANFLFSPSGDAVGDSVLISGRGPAILVSVDRWTGAIDARPY